LESQRENIKFLERARKSKEAISQFTGTKLEKAQQYLDYLEK